jgi:GNAT superfamily N-acetyltransferase
MSSIPRTKIVFEPHADERQRQYILDQLVMYNVSTTGFAPYSPVTFLDKTASGEVLGGLLGMIWGGWIHVQILWVAESLRRSGRGRQLLMAAEAFAREKGCVGSYLDTHGFQARPFYEKLGYTVVGIIEDCLVGDAKYVLMKRFDRSTTRKPKAHPASPRRKLKP